MDSTINIPFAVKLEMDSNNLGYIDHPNISSRLVYASAAKAKSTLRAQLTEEIEQALVTVKNYQTRAIGTVEGSVFIVRYHIGSWQYSIVGPGRKYGGSCHGTQSFDETVEAAKKHAIGSFDGIAWECSL